jgi:hypothetical protein
MVKYHAGHRGVKRGARPFCSPGTKKVDVAFAPSPANAGYSDSASVKIAGLVRQPPEKAGRLQQSRRRRWKSRPNLC